jgi:drug/metabolite transporter (DMT)-like permease|tara:strand:+ start:1765 stop:2598 length:834 start_codon:yes stop_codon:yes gene_type:complete
MFLVSTDAVLVRLADVDGGTFAFMSGLWSTPLMWTIANRSLGRDLGTRLREYRNPLVLTGVMGAISTTAFVTAVTKTDVANVVAIIGAGPIIAAVTARIALKEHASGRTWLAIAGAIGGILVIVGGSLSAGGATGDLLAIVAISGFGMNITIWRRHPDMPRVLIVAMTATCTVVLTALMANPLSLDRTGLMATLAMGAVFGPTARFCMTTATRHASAAEVSLFTPVETVSATLWAWLWFNEVPATLTFVGGAVVLAAVFYGVTGPAREIAPPPTAHT